MPSWLGWTGAAGAAGTTGSTQRTVGIWHASCPMLAASAANNATFVDTYTPHPVDLKLGPGGDLFYVDVGGTIRRIQFG